jgi:hypothetical protein
VRPTNLLVSSNRLYNPQKLKYKSAVSEENAGKMNFSSNIKYYILRIAQNKHAHFKAVNIKPAILLGLCY